MTRARVFRTLQEPKEGSSPCALAIGNFDGVHLGHRELLSQTVAAARQQSLTSSVLTFDPHPTTVVAPERVPEKLCSLDDRIELLSEAGVQEITVLPFTEEIARLTPEAFVRQILLGCLRVRVVLVGENFRFGYQQAGSCDTLRDLGKQLRFEVESLPPVRLRGEVVSSSAIRRYLGRSLITRANRLLGRCFSITGPVVRGYGIGKKQTVPTLNLQPPQGQLVPRGVYVTKTREVGSAREWNSITNVGTRPTFQGEEMTVETFLLSPYEEPAPVEIRVEFLHFIREERTFADPQALRTQILLDVQRAQSFWRRIKPLVSAAPSIY